jgi:hypothetical protein
MSEWKWNKQGFSNWSDKVSYELIELRQQIDAINAKLSAMTANQSGKSGPEATEATQPESKGYGEDTFPTGLPKMGKGFEESEFTTDDLVSATYALQTATIAARGYLMLLDQMGLSKDQKAMVRELEMGLMAVMKAAQAISLAKGIIEATSLNPMAILTLGGYATSSIAYMNKLGGGGI